MLDKVRVADLIGAQEATPSTSNDDALSRENETEAQRFQEVDQATHEGELELSDDLDGKGVLYCELNADSNFLKQSEDAAEKKNMV